MKKIKLLFLSIFFIHICGGRSIHRPADPLMPEITAHWVGDTNFYTLRKYHLEEYSLFQLFDKDFFEKHLLPQTAISYRYNPEQSVDSALLSQLIEELLQEVAQGKRTFNQFSILQAKDYNFKNKKGLLIVKFKQYPFVVKLFIETPDSFISPFDKGIEPIFFFFMAGGINRHMSGFTRLKNRKFILDRLAQSPWAHEIDIPRKWNWLPRHAQWIEVIGKNIGTKKQQSTQFPGTYAIIADAIEKERDLSLFNKKDKKRTLDLCNYLNLWIDPHMNNFMIEKGSQKLIIVDTEHFPSFVGLHEKVSFESYADWYLHLAGKCWKNTFMQTKYERRNPKQPNPEMSLTRHA
jgi:hypothetical protein